MIYREKFKIGLKDVGKDNYISNKGLLEILENIAAFHSDSVGYGLNTVNKTHLTWVLLDWKVKVIKRPKYGQTLDVRTWSRNFMKCYAYRDFEVYDEKENLCAIASSKWLLIDTAKASITKIEKEVGDKYESEFGKSVFEEKEITKLKVPENFQNSIIYKVRRKDIDIIGHMHNLYYLDLAYEALPDEVYQSIPFDEIRVMYKKEIKFGDVVVCKYAYTNGNHVIVIESEDGGILHAIIQLRNITIL